MFDFDTETGEIWIYDVIGPAWVGMIDASSVLTALKEMDGRDVTLRVSSPGGSVTDAVDIHNAIKRYSGKSVAVVDGIAASAASFLMLSADKVHAAKNAMLMIHQAMALTFGDRDEHQKSIQMLSRADANITAMYSDKTGKPTAEIEADMRAETWFTAAEALDYGLVDAVGDASAVTAQVPEGMFNNVPDQLRVQAEAGSRTQYPIRRQTAKIRARKHLTSR